MDTATRACLLASTNADPTGAWSAMRKMAQVGDTNVVVQRYLLPVGANSVAYVNTLVQLRCSTIVTTGTAARSAVASRLASGRIRGVQFVVVADRPVTGAEHLSPVAVNARTLAAVVGR